MVDSYRFLDPITKRVVRSWAGLPLTAPIPWTPLRKPLPECTVALVSSAALSLRGDRPFDPEIERRDPWSADPSYRVLPAATHTGEVHVGHLHINPKFALADLNTVLPLTRLSELAHSGAIGRSAPSHYSFMGYTLRPEPLLRDSVPRIIEQLRREQVDAVLLVPV